MPEAKSKRTWGREPYKTDEELNAACGTFLNEVKVPPEWKFEGYDRCYDPGAATPLHPEGTITSIGAVFLDKRTRGFDTKRYKVLFLTFSCMGAICEKSIDRERKPHYSCVVSNKTAEKLNEFIYDNYHRLEKPHRWWKFSKPIKRKPPNPRRGDKSGATNK